MNYEYEINKIKSQLQNLQEIVLRMSRNNTEEVSKREQTTAQVDSLTPYTETKTAYIGDTEVSFQNHSGNLTVFTEKQFPYSVDRNNDFIVVNFEPLEEVSTITISIQ